MRKSHHNIAVDAVNNTDYLELTRKLYRGVTDVAKRLDDQKASALTIKDIFTPSGEILRGKLKDYCERLIFNDPIGHARKIEELLWRRAFYDVVSTAKKLRKGNVWNQVEKALLSTHLSVGVGFYHHLILKLQLECGLDLAGIVDFAFPQQRHGLSDHGDRTIQQKFKSEEAQQCVIRIVHRSLICLGDLARYKLDLDPTWDPMIATRYYKMAITIDPNIGMPHNQLGTVAGNKNYGVDAVYHYMRCILCPESFEGAEGNLKRIISSHLFNGKEKLPSQRCAARLFTLLTKWNNGTPVNTDQINNDCQKLLADIDNCLITDKLNNKTNKIDGGNDDTDNNDSKGELTRTIEEYLQNYKSDESLKNLSDDIIFKMVAICLMSISKLQSKESSQVHGIIAFILSLLSQLIQIVIDNLQKCIVESLPNGLLIKEKVYDAEEKQIVEPENSEELNNDVDINVNYSKKFNDNKTNSVNGHLVNVNGNNKSKGKAKKSLLSKLRRPRKRINSSDSDNSDVDGPHLDDSSDDLNSDISETEEDALSDCQLNSDPDDITDDEIDQAENCFGTEEVGLLNGHATTGDDDKLYDGVTADNFDKHDTAHVNGANSPIDYMYQKKHVDQMDYFNALSKERLFYSIKICFDWLKGNPEIIKMIANSSRTLLQRIAGFLNLINIDTSVVIDKWDRESVSLTANKLQEYTKIVPLPEDIDLRGLNVLENAHKDINWKILRKFMINKNEEILLRILKLIDFGKFICTIEDSDFKFDEKQNLYVVVDLKEPVLVKKDKQQEECDVVNDNNEINSDHPRGKLMRHMGKLWLKAEVRALETRLRSKLMSPYLVVDHEALTKHTPVLKRLVYAKKFVIVIPSIVVSALDEMKRTSGRAREATRWLENQLQKGSRFLRAQRQHERLALPLIKGPKPKDKEAWLFFQIIECCHYLTQQNKVGLSSDNEAPVVTLLTGINTEDRKSSTFSPDGLAKSAGINLEHIESFHTKWKTSSKSHG
ncbi:nonsense-mediated mRNA decay factor SMG5 [Microplitis mediator]|uniref:nonsense-mediated mRNA decay factor SMG5 n=1 Tax=Microplitis mediator TaxID=375433 RepID=UPI0025532137|nr:nonsense-mediated mRNA decay factor SMG5 [Microplitis mediator]